jgi:hypothetical protein
MVLTTATQTLTNKDIVATQLTGDVAAARITTALNASGSAPIYACRAWVNFDGTGTPAIRGSGNVSSITDSGTGDYTVNFTTALPDANYAALPAAGNNNTNTTLSVGPITQQTASAFRFMTLNGSQGYADYVQVSVAIFR